MIRTAGHPRRGDISVAALFEAKVRAELADADQHVPPHARGAWSGDAMAAVMLVKGEPGAVELAGGDTLSGPDGVAAGKALAALGYQGTTFGTLSRPTPEVTGDAAVARLREQLEAVEPGLVIALDGVAAGDLAAATGVPVPSPGLPVTSAGRRLLVLSGLEASLADDARKAVVWGELRSLVRTGPGRERGAQGRPVESLF